jgi:hypothetical protein
MLPISFESGRRPSFLSSLERQRPVLRRVDDLVGDIRVRHLLRRVEHAQPQPRAEEPLDRPIERGLVNQSLVVGDQQRRIRLAAVQLTTVLHGQCGCLLPVLRQTVIAPDVVYRAAVGDHVAVEAPFLA